jgi:hypothetical protein
VCVQRQKALRVLETQVRAPDALARLPRRLQARLVPRAHQGAFPSSQCPAPSTLLSPVPFSIALARVAVRMRALPASDVAPLAVCTLSIEGAVV